MYRSPPPSDFRCGRYPAAWNPTHKVTSKAASFRFEIVAGAVTKNTSDPAEALRLARQYVLAGADVSVRDRSRRRGYLTELELEALTHG